MAYGDVACVGECAAGRAVLLVWYHESGLTVIVAAKCVMLADDASAAMMVDGIEAVVI